jgi:hypothetical protein
MSPKAMMKYLPAALLSLSLMFLFQACQDDPELQPVVDGSPVITPKSRAYITTIQINSFPDLDPNGNPWDMVNPAEGDTLGLADIFFNITIPDPSPPVIWSQGSHFANVPPGDTVPFFLLTHFEIVPFESNIDLNIYDFELPDSTLMGTVPFFIGTYPDPQNPYPSYITSSQNGYSVTIGLRYEE